jgi:hypothetical protein
MRAAAHFALIAALALADGCQEREQLEKEAPALAHADFTLDRIAVAGVVSSVPALADSDRSRESWSLLIGDHLGRERFGKLPIVSFGDVRQGFFAGLATSIANSTLKPEPKYPPAPELEESLAKGFDSVGEYLKPKKKH